MYVGRDREPEPPDRDRGGRVPRCDTRPVPKAPVLMGNVGCEHQRTDDEGGPPQKGSHLNRGRRRGERAGHHAHADVEQASEYRRREPGSAAGVVQGVSPKGGRASTMRTISMGRLLPPSLEELHRPLVPLGRGSSGERAQIAPSSGLRVFGPGVEAVLARGKYANNGCGSLPSRNRVVQNARSSSLSTPSSAMISRANATALV